MVKLAILSDIHSAAGAYEAALESAQRQGFDVLVLLGDLLTYGPFPERTIEVTEDAISKHETVLLEGNHDQFYLSGRRGARQHKNGWIDESIEWTLDRVDVDRFAKLGWERELIIEDLLLSHANPYPFGDWSYLRSEDEFCSAIAALNARGLRYGIFGHSHRHVSVRNAEGMAMTVGSVGQPRSTSSKLPQWATATLQNKNWHIEVHPLDFDWRAHCDSIRSTSLSEPTKDRLCEFFL